MVFDDLIINESFSMKEAIERLYSKDCLVLYVTSNEKLIASLSLGDVERFLRAGKSGEEPVKENANYYPRYLNQFEIENKQNVFELIVTPSMPVVNLNREIVEVIFQDGRRVRRNKGIGIPVVMMAGGEGTRLYPYTKILPKPLIPIGETPISERIINNFVGYGCKNIHMILHYKKEMIKAYFDLKESEYRISFYEEDKPLGTGGGLCLIKNKIDSNFFIVNCDVYIDADYELIYKSHVTNNNIVTMVVATHQSVVPYGVVEFDDDGQFLSINEKPSTEYYINTGMYIAKPDIFNYIPENKALGFPDIIESLKVKGERVGVYVIEDNAYMDMGQFEEMEKMISKMGV